MGPLKSVVADVVGYSRLAGADEERTLARLRAPRGDLIDPSIALHHGRIVKRTGDGAIIESRSVVGAADSAHPEAQTFTSVAEKSSPLNRSGAPMVAASASAAQSARLSLALG
jgi:class 3 adenylate cyclase